MSESNNSTVLSQGDAMLAAAFETKVSEQVEENLPQVEQEGVDPNPAPSSPGSGMPPSSSSGPSREELLASLTWDEVKALEHLKSPLKSEIDSEAAKYLRGKTREIEERVREETRQQTTVEFWRERFDKMDEQELSDTLRTDPDARRLYALVTAPPPPPQTPNTETSGLLTYFQNIIQVTNTRVQALPEEYRKTLDPQTYANSHPDMEPNELIAKWQGEIMDAEVAVKLAGSKNPDDEESRRLDQRGREQDSGGALMDQSSSQVPPPDWSQRSDVLLENAFAQKQAMRR